MIVVDTSVIVAYMNARDHAHELVATWLDAVDDNLATTPLIVAEVDHLVGARDPNPGNPRQHPRI